MSKIFALSAALVLTGLIGGTAGYVWYKQAGDPFAECRSSAVGGGAIGGPFTLQDETGALISDREVLTTPALIYFGYSFCPDVCPLDNVRNAEAVDILEEQGFDVTPVFISIDPERDTPEVMGDYAEMIHPKMRGLTGSLEQVKAAAQAYKVYYKKAQTDDPDFYLMDHSTFTYLMLPDKGFADFFRREESSDRMAERVACFMQNS